LADKMRDVGIDPESDIGRQLIYLVNDLLGFPRHLSQHVGGMVITQGALDELVPIENASMDGRTVIQWDKDDLEELGLLKVDCLSLGMLSAIRRCFAMVQQHWGQSCTLANLPQEDSLVYDMICDADTIGVFQIESRGWCIRFYDGEMAKKKSSIPTKLSNKCCIGRWACRSFKSKR